MLKWFFYCYDVKCGVRVQFWTLFKTVLYRTKMGSSIVMMSSLLKRRTLFVLYRTLFKKVLYSTKTGSSIVMMSSLLDKRTSLVQYRTLFKKFLYRTIMSSSIVMMLVREKNPVWCKIEPFPKRFYIEPCTTHSPSLWRTISPCKEPFKHEMVLYRMCCTWFYIEPFSLTS